jgi:SAM-dependent methyltransferase
VPSAHFTAAYEGTPPWDIGRPQAEFVRLAEAGEIRGAVLDAGCGTGENALFLASRGHEAVGIDFVPAAIERARIKALERGLAVDFRVGDALRLADLGRSFDTVVDSGLFHTFDDDERTAWAASLAAVLRPGGRYFMLCFSEHEKGGGGPRRVTQAEIRATFGGSGWHVVSINPARLSSHLGSGGRWARLTGSGGRRAWLATIERTEERASGEPARG